MLKRIKIFYIDTIKNLKDEERQIVKTGFLENKIDLTEVHEVELSTKYDVIKTIKSERCSYDRVELLNKIEEPIIKAICEELGMSYRIYNDNILVTNRGEEWVIERRKEDNKLNVLHKNEYKNKGKNKFKTHLQRVCKDFDFALRKVIYTHDINLITIEEEHIDIFEKAKHENMPRFTIY